MFTAIIARTCLYATNRTNKLKGKWWKIKHSAVTSESEENKMFEKPFRRFDNQTALVPNNSHWSLTHEINIHCSCCRTKRFIHRIKCPFINFWFFSCRLLKLKITICTFNSPVTHPPTISPPSNHHLTTTLL